MTKNNKMSHFCFWVQQCLIFLLLNLTVQWINWSNLPIYVNEGSYLLSMAAVYFISKMGEWEHRNHMEGLLDLVFCLEILFLNGFFLPMSDKKMCLLLGIAIFGFCVGGIWCELKDGMSFGRKVREMARFQRNCLAVGFVLIAGITIFQSGITNTRTAPRTRAQIDAVVEEKEAEMTERLRQKDWDTLSLKERVDLLQEVVKTESAILGIPNVPKVSAQNLESDTTLGNYHSLENEIHLNKKRLKEFDLEEALNTTCHEVRHAYQHELCRIYMEMDPSNRRMHLFTNVEILLHEFIYYENGENFDAYYNQYCEREAREYGAIRSHQYMKRLEQAA